MDKLLDEYDRKITIRFKKIKGKNKTCIYGLEKVLDNNKISDFLKKIKKRLGCGGVQSEDDDKNKMIEFMGDHREILKEIIIEENIMSKDKIELKGG